MSNSTYWEKRRAQNMYELMETAEQTADTIGQVYHKASNYLTYEMDTIFERFAKKHKLSEEEAKELLTVVKDKNSLEEIKKELMKAPAGSDKRKLLAELESPAYKARLDRLMEKQEQIDNLMTQVYNQEKKISTSHYSKFAEEAYNRSVFSVQSQAGVGFAFAKADKAIISTVLAQNWSGAHYSSRIWNNTSKLADILKTELMVGFLTGKTEREMSETILNDFAVSANQARRLIRTESCAIATEMDMRAYEECGVETYIFVATLDLKTSDICQSLDGKRFKTKDKAKGVNAPPMHPWCRSTTICDITDEELAQMKRRSRNPETGKNEFVPANMTYGEWKKKYAGRSKTDNRKEQYHGGIPKNWNKIKSVDNAIKNANPFYDGRVGTAYSTNCPNCAVAFEMRKRGYNVIARPNIKGGSHYLNEYPWEAWENVKVQNIDSLKTLNDISKNYPDGSRFGISYINKYTDGHVIVGEKIDGEIHLFDPQKGIEIKDIDFNKVSDVQLWQTDNLNPSDRGITACEKGD